MRISEQSISELETVLSQFEKENGVIDLGFQRLRHDGFDDANVASIF